jgi:hypothetical protein
MPVSFFFAAFLPGADNLPTYDETPVFCLGWLRFVFFHAGRGSGPGWRNAVWTIADLVAMMERLEERSKTHD